MPSGCRPKTTQLARGAGSAPDTSSTCSTASVGSVSLCIQPAGVGSGSSETVGPSGLRLVVVIETVAAAALAGRSRWVAVMTASAILRA